ncbi:MAG: hypothetical protein LBE84_03370 [Planctomycetota bacterium]|jgi:YbbR domain-containing protein|nr:hypothetical protein [Planctomycetota bacterium]
MFLSLVIGALLWYGVDLNRLEDFSFPVDIKFENLLPEGWSINELTRNSIQLTVRGSRQEMAGIRKEDVSLLPVFPGGAFRENAYSGMLSLQTVQVQGLPAGVEVLSLTPPLTPFRLVRSVSRKLTVQAGEMTGTLQEGFVFGRVIRIDPPFLEVFGPQDFIEKLGASDVVRTRTINIEGLRAGVAGRIVGLEPLEKDGERVIVPGTVYVALEINELPGERSFSLPFEVKALIDSPFNRYTAMTISPPSAMVTVSGPRSVVDKLSEGEITVYADMRDRIPAAQGEFNLRCKAMVPPQVKVVRIDPDTVKWLVGETVLPTSTPGDKDRLPGG